MKKLLFNAAMMFLFFPSFCQPVYNGSDMQKLGWLQGSWKGSTGTSDFYEAWRFYNDSILVNFAIELKDGEPVFKESSVLRVVNGKLQLGQAPVIWTASRLMANELVLTNDTLKYSNRIIWLHTKDDHWFTILEHPGSTVYYDMVRQPELDKKLDAWIERIRREKGD